MLAVPRDISENKKTLLALKESESKFRRIFESDLIGFFFYDTKGNIIEANQKFLEMAGYPFEESSSGQLRWRDLTPPEYTARDNEALKEVQLKGTCDPYEKQFIRKDDSRLNVILGAVSINKNEGIAYIIDNSHRKKVEKSLRRTNALLADIQKLSHVGTWEWFLKADKVIWSDEMFNILGLEPQEFEVKTQSIFKFIHPDDQDKVSPAMTESFVENKTNPLEYRIVRSNGEIRHVLGLGYALLNKDNQVDRIAGSLQDITDRKLAEDQIRKEKQLSDSIINSLPGIFYLFDDSGRMLRWNENLETISGYTSVEIANMRPAEFVDPAERDMIEVKIAEILNHGIVELEAFILTKSGEKIPFYFTGSRVVFETRVCIIGMGINISERRKAEQQLKENEQQLEVIYHTVRDIIYMLSVEKERYKFISINHQFLESTGLQEKQVIGRYVNEVIPEPSLSTVLEKYRESIKTKKTVTWKESTEYPSGVKVALVTVSPVMDEEGKCIKLVGSVSDITEREEAEKEIKERNEQLHQLSAHLQNIREEERASVAREIHDELGQQLTVIKMDVSWINKKIQSEEGKIIQKIQSLLHLVDSAISTVRKISSDLRPSILDDFGLKEALQWQISEFEKRTGISCHFVAGIPDRKLDKKISISLFRIFQESLTNVARHAEAHNVWAVIKCRSGNLELTITDDGKGMDVSSMGLKHTMGLIGMKERVKMTEGTFNLISTPGNGTIVRVAVPFEDVVPPKIN
jgi:PAS domain S-box-containing protein